MTVALLDSHQRMIAAACALGFGALAAIVAWRRRRSPWAVGLAAAAVLAAAALAADRAVAALTADAAGAPARFNDYRWVALAPWGRIGVVVGIAAAAAVILLGWASSRRVASPWRRGLLVGLRTGAACAALVLFLEPAIELRQVAREPNHIAVVVDQSRSMSLHDGGSGPSRRERARAILDASAPTFARWRKNHILDFYGFSSALTPSTEAAVASAPPRGTATLIRHALEKVRARYEGRDLAGVVLLSDGTDTSGFEQDGKGSANAELLRSLHTRVHTVWTARPGLRDVAVAHIYADEFAFVHTVVKVEALVRSTGYGARRIPVVLSRGGKPLLRKWVDLAAGNTQARVAFQFTPAHVGKYAYAISTPVADDEAVKTNNARAFVLRVIRDKIRVLQVAGQPSWDVKALRSMLKANPNVDLISFFILRTQDDVSLVPNDELSLIPFPTRELFQEQLPSFDLIILQNFNYYPYGIGTYLDNIRSYVKNGGGLVMLGGPLSFASGQYAGTPIADLLPVTLPRRSDHLIDTSPFAPVLTRAGRAHPITALRFEPRDNLAAWKSLPDLEGVNLVGDAKPNATVLAVHPTLKTADGHPMPVIVAGRYGKGRTLAVTTDSLWRWDFVAAGKPGDGGRHYDQFWDNAIRWLIHDPDLRYLQVSADKVAYRPGKPVRIDARLVGPSYTPVAGGKITLEIERGANPATATRVTTAALTTDGAGQASRELRTLSPGVYQVRASAEVSGRTVNANDVFLVRRASTELDRPAGDDRALAAIAAATGGTHLRAPASLPADLPFAEPKVSRVDRRSDLEVWDRPSLLLLALAFLGLEWGLRQRSHTR